MTSANSLEASIAVHEARIEHVEIRQREDRSHIDKRLGRIEGLLVTVLLGVAASLAKAFFKL